MQTYSTQNNFTDSDMSKKARNARYGEYLGLKQLPFLNKEQLKRRELLSDLIKRDNKFSFQQECYNAQRKD